ncbi:MULTISPECIES: GNAT family N-acetyltransferase [Leptospira]|uniref:GNAT family N-acetyltransferase n=1 Tax=Leptospira interrogans TaxID=173 RepID=A0AAV9FWP3_LEPIR|nr:MULTISPECIES: GNAT family N-acetyltransferase [Leptospira]KAK2617210.1 GNAT family N-acetyltransferase [Leptospira interrogans]
MKLLKNDFISNKIERCNSEYYIYLLQNQKEILEKANSITSLWQSYIFDIYTKHISPQIDNDSKNIYDLLKEYNIEDFQWNWNNKAFHKSEENYIWCIFTIEDKCEGAIIFKHPEKSDLYSHNIVYIDYLAAAPWNRKSILAPRKYEGIATLLLKTAVNFGIKQFNYYPGFKLHSLPHAESFYTKMGMSDLGIDIEKEKLRKYEMGIEQCNIFLSIN